MSVLTTPLSLLTRYITINLILDQGQFAGGSAGQNEKIITANSDNDSLSVEVVIQKSGGFLQNSANITIYGMTIEDCNSFTRFNQLSPLQMYANRVQVYAGYSLGTNGLPPLAYDGQVYIAGADFNNPSRPFKIVSLAGIYSQNVVAPHTNPQGAVSLSNLFQGIISNSQNPNLVYMPNNVQGTVSNVVYTGSWIQQMQHACDDYGYQFTLDGNNVMIAPKGSAYTNAVFNLSADTGMLGYPNIVQLGVDVRTRYNPSIIFGQQINVTSTLQTQANGTWFINGLAHTLSNQGPKFETALKLNRTFFNLGVQGYAPS